MLRKFRWLIIGLVVLAGGYVALNEAWDWAKSYYGSTLPRPSRYPSSGQPDLICLTWSGEPSSTQAVQWRTGPAVTSGVVEYRKRDAQEAATAQAVRETLEDKKIENDPVNNRYTAHLEGLEPGTAYSYRVGNGQDAWSAWADFTTAPAGAAPFSFCYLGDPQVGFDVWGNLLQQAVTTAPTAAFWVMAGDLVNRGNFRDQWDEFFGTGTRFFAGRPVVPAIGNHECPHGDEPWGYLAMFALPGDGPDGIPKEHAYAFNYGNALFCILDSNKSAAAQRPWLEKQLSESKSTWKFAVYHHPMFSSADDRDNDDVREQWGPLFDQYHVDMALQGHDHAYLRTPPMRDGKPAASAADGTYYVISVSGTKFYDQEKHDYAAVAFPDTQTYQVIDIVPGEVERLTYRAYDISGKVRDEVVIEKPRRQP